jgi:hypothetical protein
MSDVAFPFNPDWSNGFSISYSFETNLFQSTHEKEQRTGLRNKPSRKLAFSLWEKKDEAYKILNFIRANYRNTIIVPILTEIVKPLATSDMYNVGALAVDDPTAKYNFSELSGYLLLRDTTGTNPLAITTVTTLAYSTPYWILTWNDLYPYHTSGINLQIIPAAACYADPPAVGIETDNLLSFDLAFDEKEQII